MELLPEPVAPAHVLCRYVLGDAEEEEEDEGEDGEQPMLEEDADDVIMGTEEATEVALGDVADVGEDVVNIGEIERLHVEGVDDKEVESEREAQDDVRAREGDEAEVLGRVEPGLG